MRIIGHKTLTVRQYVTDLSFQKTAASRRLTSYSYLLELVLNVRGEGGTDMDGHRNTKNLPIREGIRKMSFFTSPLVSS